MPILKHAKKKLLVDKKRAEANKKVKTAVKNAIKKFRVNPSSEILDEVYSVVDRAAKKYVFNRGRADRIKSRLSKVLANAGKKEVGVAKKAVKKVATKTAKKVVKKTK